MKIFGREIEIVDDFPELPQQQIKFGTLPTKMIGPMELTWPQISDRADELGIKIIIEDGQVVIPKAILESFGYVGGDVYYKEGKRTI